jgi:glycerol-3-phosphate responsive antiterminator
MSASQIIPKHRKTKRWSQKFSDIKIKVINFINRSAQDIIRAMEMLLGRYKTVRVEKKLVKGLYQGYFTCS